MGLSQARLGELVGTTQGQIQKLESGVRKMTIEWAQKLAPALNCEPIDLVPHIFKKINAAAYVNTPSLSKSQAVESVITIPVRGIVAAGLYMDSDTDVTEEIPIPFSPLAARTEQFAFRVSGTSMNKKIPDGAYVLCVPYWHVREAITDKDTVVVERRKAGLIERTCKEVVVTATHYELWPRSTDQKWQTPIRIERQGEFADEDGTEIEVVGRVIGIYMPI